MQACVRDWGLPADARSSSASLCFSGNWDVPVQMETVVMAFNDKCAQEQDQVDAVEVKLREMGVDARKLQVQRQTMLEDRDAFQKDLNNQEEEVRCAPHWSWGLFLQVEFPLLSWLPLSCVGGCLKTSQATDARFCASHGVALRASLQVNKARAAVAEAKEEGVKLRQQIVESPERLQSSLEELTEQIESSEAFKEALKQEVEALAQKKAHTAKVRRKASSDGLSLKQDLLVAPRVMPWQPRILLFTRGLFAAELLQKRVMRENHW